MGARTLAGPGVERRRLAELLLIAAMLAVFASSVLSPAIGSQTYRIATASAPSQVELLALALGTLNGQVNDGGTACFWLAYNGYRTALFWPYGYSARGFPLAVYDAAGRRVADVSRLTFIGGGRSPDAAPILGCPGMTRIWLVGHVVSQN